MPMAAGPATPVTTDRAPHPAVFPPVVADSFAKDAILAWFRGEFAAANAIIDALCGHLAGAGGSDYDSVFSAIHRRRLNWIPVLQMQKYHSIADVAVELRKVAERKEAAAAAEAEAEEEKNRSKMVEEEAGKVMESEENGSSVNGGDYGGEVVEEEDSPDSDITDSGSQEAAQHQNHAIKVCFNHDECGARTSQIKLTKGFNAKEHVKGHMVNVVKGLKLYEDIFTESELSKLTDLVNELRVAGQNGELSGETYISFNKQMKGNRRELVQFGIPIFGHIKEEATSNNQSSDLEPIPALLQDAVDHLIQWQLIPEYKRPNGCIIHFFDEGEYSQPFLKPPHLEQPLSTLVLSEATMAFGRILVSDNDGNYRGPLMLSLKEGSLLVMRGNSADLARHVLCPSPSKRACITFFRVRPEQVMSPPTSPMAGSMTLWQPGVQSPYPVNGVVSGYETMEMMPKWGVLRSPVVMLAPVRPVVLNPKRMPRGGTGVFLPWTVGSRKPAKHLPPRAQRTRLLALPSADSTNDTRIKVEGK